MLPPQAHLRCSSVADLTTRLITSDDGSAYNSLSDSVTDITEPHSSSNRAAGGADKGPRNHHAGLIIKCGQSAQFSVACLQNCTCAHNTPSKPIAHMSPLLWYDLCLQCTPGDAETSGRQSSNSEGGALPGSVKRAATGRHGRRLARALALGYSVVASSAIVKLEELATAERWVIAQACMHAGHGHESYLHGPMHSNTMDTKKGRRFYCCWQAHITPKQTEHGEVIAHGEVMDLLYRCCSNMNAHHTSTCTRTRTHAYHADTRTCTCTYMGVHRRHDSSV